MFGALISLKFADKKTGPKETSDYALRLMDSIQARYGWTDDIVLNLPVRRLAELTEVLRKRDAEETQRQQINQSYLAWQLTQNITGALGREGKYPPFEAYLKAYGVLSSDPATAAEKAEEQKARSREAKRAIEKAERIRKLDQEKAQ